MAATHIPNSNVAGQPVILVSNSHRWGVVWLLFVASMINYFDRATLSFALPAISKEFSLDPAEQGILLSSFSWSYALLQIPVGFYADRLNLRWLYAAAFALWSVSQGLMGFAGSVTALFTLRILLGAGESIYLPGGTKIVSLLFKSDERGLPCGLFDFGTRTGLVLEGMLLPIMLEKMGWRKTFIIVGFTALLWLIPWMLVLPKQISAATKPATSGGPISFAGHALKLITNRNLVGICLGFFCFDYYWFLLLNWLPKYLIDERGLGMLKGGFYASLPFLIFGICQPLGGWIADRLIRNGGDEMRIRKTIITIAFLTGLFLIPVTSVENPNAALGLLLFGGVVGLSTANMIVILQAYAPKDQVGLWVGIYNFIGNIAGIIAPILTGYLLKYLKSFTIPFILASVLLLLGIYSFWAIVGSQKHTEPTTTA